AAPPFAALPVRARRPDALRAAVVVLAETPAPRPGIGPVPHRLRRPALRRGVRARARRLPRLPCARPQHGAVALPADDRRRHSPPEIPPAGRNSSLGHPRL